MNVCHRLTRVYPNHACDTHVHAGTRTRAVAHANSCTNQSAHRSMHSHAQPIHTCTHKLTLLCSCWHTPCLCVWVRVLVCVCIHTYNRALRIPSQYHSSRMSTLVIICSPFRDCNRFLEPYLAKFSCTTSMALALLVLPARVTDRHGAAG